VPGNSKTPGRSVPSGGGPRQQQAPDHHAPVDQEPESGQRRLAVASPRSPSHAARAHYDRRKAAGDRHAAAQTQTVQPHGRHPASLPATRTALRRILRRPLTRPTGNRRPRQPLLDTLTAWDAFIASVSVVAVLPGGGPPGSVPVTRRDSHRIWPSRRALRLTCPSRLPAPAWPTSWPDQKPVRPYGRDPSQMCHTVTPTQAGADG
jgi:hypothetical protein